MADFSRRTLTEEEAIAIRHFLTLPLDEQGLLLPLFTRRARFVLEALDCLADGPKTYYEMSEMLGIARNTVAQYCIGVFSKQDCLPLKKSKIFAGQGSGRGQWQRTWQVTGPILPVKQKKSLHQGQKNAH